MADHKYFIQKKREKTHIDFNERPQFESVDADRCQHLL